MAPGQKIEDRFMEEAVQFTCKGKWLYGILHVPDGQRTCRDAVIMVNGGPQTRYGSHRLYVQLARFLCERGINVFRFDYEGIGDSEGDFAGAEYAEPSIHAAIQYIGTRFPECNRKIIWSLCDGATASALYASQHNGLVTGLILCNPFIRNEVALYHKHYYKKRLLDKDLWVRLLGLKIKFKEAFSETIEIFHAMLRRTVMQKTGNNDEKPEPFTQESLLRCFQHTRIPTCCMLSMNDVVAKEFSERILRRKNALQGNGNIKIYTIDGADHTFSVPGTKEVLFSLTLNALREIGSCCATE